MSKNTFSVTDNTIYISRPEWDFIAQATIRDDYVDEIQSVTWGLQHDRYPYNAKLGTLHSYVMKQWYGEEFCNEMKEKGFVIDHMDNESHNCCIENLYFLKEAYNKAKGMTFDQENKDKRFIALTISRNFDTELFQITISFNYPATLQLEGFEHPAVIELAYLLYAGDYRTVIADAQDILMDYKNDYVFRPEKLRAIDYHIEGCIGKALPPEVHEEYLSGTHGHGVVYFNRLAPQRGWSKETKEKFFILTDLENSQQYQIKLVL